MAFRIAADLPALLDEVGVTSWEGFRGSLQA